MSLEITKQRLLSAKGRVDKFIDQNIIIWATEEILLPGQGDIEASGLSARAAQALSLDKTGFMKFDLKWDFRGPNNEPLHFFIEFGTKPHIIRPKGKIAGGADVLHWKGASGGFVIGEDHYAAIVNHPGTKAKNLVQTIKDEREPDLQARIINEVENKMEIEKI